MEGCFQSNESNENQEDVDIWKKHIAYVFQGSFLIVYIVNKTNKYNFLYFKNNINMIKSPV